MLTTVRHIFGRIMHSETALCSQWDKGWKNNLLFASPSIRRPTPWGLWYVEVCYSFVCIIFCTVSNATVPVPCRSLSGKRTINYIISALSPSFSVDE